MCGVMFFLGGVGTFVQPIVFVAEILFISVANTTSLYVITDMIDL